MLSHVDLVESSQVAERQEGAASQPSSQLLSQSKTQDSLSGKQIRALEAEQSRPRMVISKMVLRNFKSYAGVVEIGPFHKSFTSVVGPNGSGKSNVIDSLLFVFGFKAKKMRQGKLSELIHNSANHKNLDSCSVEVHFQEIVDLPGPDAFEVVPNSTLVVSRTVERATTEKGADKSTYRINRRSSNFTEVTTLLKDKGVDLDHKRFLILQGEVESISLMKPKAQNEHEDGLLEYLEDIIGTARYKAEIDATNVKMDALNEERGEKLNRLKFVEKDKRSLEAKKEEAETFIRTENQLVHAKNKLFHICIDECSKDIDRNQTIVEDLSTKLEAERAKHSGLASEVKTLEKSHKSTQKEYESIAAKAESVRNELQRYDRAEVELTEKITHLEKKEKKLRSTVHKEKLERSEHETWIRNFDNDMSKAQKEGEELAEKLAEEEEVLKEIRESLKGKTEGFQKQIEKKQEELAPWMEKINAKQGQLDLTTSERDILESNMHAAQTALKDAEQKVVELRAQHREKAKEKKQLEAQQKELQGQRGELQGQLQNCATKEEDLRKTVVSSRAKADEARVNLQAAQSRGKVHNSLMQQSHAGRIQGICGRLGDLGVIDDQYDVAVTTACGSLDAIVVDHVESAQQCIEYLRKQSVGRATFLSLDKLTKWNTAPIKTPENVPRLFDLIKPKQEKYAPAFYQVLRDTLVAKDLEQANRIAYGAKRFRVVTLEGQLIDTSGTLSGGGSKPQRGGMSSKFASDEVTQQTVANLAKQKDDAEKDHEKVKVVKAELTERIEALDRELPVVSLELEKAMLGLKSLEESVLDAEKHVETLRTRKQGPSAEDVSRYEELQALTTTLTKDIEKLTRNTTKISDEITALQVQILQIGGVRLRTQHAKVDGLNEHISINSSRMTKLRVERSSRDKALTKVVKSIVKNEGDAENTCAEIDAIEGELEKQRGAVKEVTAKVKEAEEILESKEAELEDIKQELDAKTEQMNDLRKFEVEAKARLDGASKELAQKQSQRKYFQKEIDTNLRLQVTGFEEYEEPTELPKYSEEEVGQLEKKVVESEIQNLQAKLDEGTPNLSVLAEYKQKHEAYLARAKDLEDVTQLRDQAKARHDELRTRRLTEFMEGFTAISQKLKEMYQLITLGGNAELELVDSLDPFSEGIIFSVMPPKKSWKNISNLSGGEKTLSSLALVFALHHFKPTPLYVMDEIDAALDFRNVSIVANYIKERTKNAQFIIISLRNNMFELADRLVGIYKTDNTTKSITINPNAL
ncbi:putative nuclear condensin complex subunit Smc4 [Fimicolochytrium jonesii]|uniref:putative nuclear condensin complex subunit Smc4 n=1 Tax=Fimicolochytrium jonesii TaxID=1396493 RepID=UPI0022FDC71E|nr:putative nuclear condensin complex subunit Smc4 [Fimicolochytrium jonesii]KAI8817530.1 putative nuclear condensin complex subunit Smc4 [Fimicolochytrium jonesii]